MRFHQPWREVVCILSLLGLGACNRQNDSTPAGDGQELAAPSASTKTARREVLPDPATRLRKARDEAMAETDPAIRERLLAEVIWNAFESDPDFAQECFDQLEPGSASTLRLLSHVGLRLAEQDMASALEWARGIELEVERMVALGAVALVLSNQDPTAAAAIAFDEMTQSIERDRCAVQITQRWVQQDPPAAAAWIAEFPADAAREAGMRTIVDTWMRSDPAAMTRWLLASGNVESWQPVIVALLDSEVDSSKRETLRSAISQAGLQVPGSD